MFMSNIVMPSVPSMPGPAVARLEAGLASASAYLEYGSGGSTALALRSGLKALVCVESDKNWLSDLKTSLDQSGSTTCLFVHADIGPTKEWGHPVDDTCWKQYHRYPLLGWQEAAAAGIKPDLILIDGRFRRACFYATLLHAKSGATILFDDYSDRRFYHSVEAFAKPVAMHDRMAEFVVPKLLNRDAVWLALVEAITEVH